ncbi:MAG: TraM recognition domain-containing protein, partial [Rhodobacteraceae bacterium]|nr:TraM recognition domain-containing protein [Paracoccaceae bacterium]
NNPPFHMYVDEFGQYVTPVVAAALDEIRKKNIFFTVAHQHLAQLENDEMGKQIRERPVCPA